MKPLLLWFVISSLSFACNNIVSDAFPIPIKAFNAVGAMATTTGTNKVMEKSRGVSRTRSCFLVVRRMMKQKDEGSILNNVGIGVQPIVWLSLYTVATTGAGLPPGPFGLLGALEGLSYLLVGGLVLSNFFTQEESAPNSIKKSQKLSTITLAIAALVLIKLVTDQGCIPNAKPILDYSQYVPICKTTPGLFGG